MRKIKYIITVGDTRFFDTKSNSEAEAIVSVRRRFNRHMRHLWSWATLENLTNR